MGRPRKVGLVRRARVTIAGAVLALVTVGTGQTFEQRLKSFGFIAQPGANCVAPLLLGSDGALYGTAAGGGSNNLGVIFKVNRDGTGFSVLHSFAAGMDGQVPTAGLLQGADGALYGTTLRGGPGAYGTVFKLNQNGSGYDILHSFPANVSDGKYPSCRLVQGADGMIYGTTSSGGGGGVGTVFKLRTNGLSYAIVRYFRPDGVDGQAPGGLAFSNSTSLCGTTLLGGSNGMGTIYTMRNDGTQYGVLHHFARGLSDGQQPNEVVIGSDGGVYGTTRYGGTGRGIVFRCATNAFTVLHAFGSTLDDGVQPMAGLLKGGDGALYGTTSTGGKFAQGSVFKINEDGTGYTAVYSSSTTYDDATSPKAALVQDSDGVLYGTCPTSLFKLNSDGSGFMTVFRLSPGGGDGQLPATELVQGSDGTLYGTAQSGGSRGRGALFKVKSDGGSYSVLHSFGEVLKDGLSPSGALLRAGDAIYGVASAGGGGGQGIVFRLKIDGTDYSVLHSFLGRSADDGGSPNGGLIQATDAALYGTTYAGGTSNAGTVFSLRDDGMNYSVLHVFGVAAGDGQQPRGRLMQASDGALYGTTYAGGSNGAGTVFMLLTNNSGYGVLHSFVTNGIDGVSPYAGLVEGADGALYGTTYAGGSNGAGTVFKLQRNGSAYSVIHTFWPGNGDGQNPYGGLIQGTDGALYGTTYLGGSGGKGVVFRFSPGGGDYAVVHSFAASGGGGQRPYAGLIQGIDGELYGTTSLGGDMNYGTVFRLLIPPAFIGFVRMPDSSLQLSLAGLPNTNYVIQASSDLSNWIVLTNISGPVSPLVFTDFDTTNFQRRFYRALYSQ